MSNTLRITGMASGLDVDSMVQKLMKAENMRVDKMKQDRQVVQWKQDIYRDVLGDISNFKSTFFDSTHPDKYMLSASNFSAFDVTSDSPLSASATASGYAAAGVYTLSNITLATTAEAIGQSVNVSGNPKLTVNDKMSSVVGNSVVNFKINGIECKYDFSAADKDKTIADVMKDISSKTGLKASFSELGGVFSLSTRETGSSQSMSLNWDNNDSTSADFLKKLFNVNPSDPGVVNDSVTNHLVKTIKGTDASVTIKDPKGISGTVTNSNNSFAIDGINYNLIQNTTSDVKINVTANSQKVVDRIKEYLGKYNDIVGKIQSKLMEKKDRNYIPLTDDQKKDMKDEDIKKWEDKAKQGLVKGDSELQNLLRDMRSGLFQSVSGAGINFSDIGLDTSMDPYSGGKIVIKDETKLNNFIANNGDKVTDLFMKKSSIPYSKTLTKEERTNRSNEEGIFQRLNDVLEDYTSTRGGKGILLQKAGIKGDLTEFKNTFTEQLNDKDKAIKTMLDKLSVKEDNYYKQFSKLEQAMQQMNSQQSWLTQQLGGVR